MANNILINVQGLLEGKRVRKLGLKARLYYPLLLGLANTFARLELDYDLLADKFASFCDSDADATSIAVWFKEYEKVKLVLLYAGNDAGAEEPTMWAQFDTPSEYRRSYASKDDAASPAPPEPAYTDWLKSIHGATWEQYHLTNYQRERQSDISGKRAEAGRKGAAVTNAKRWGANGDSQQNQQTDFAESANQQSRLGIGVVEGQGVGGDEGDTTISNLKSETGSVSILPNQSQSGTETAKTVAPVRVSGKANIPVPKNKKDSAPSAASSDASYDLDGTAEEFARAWGLLMKHNEKFDPSKLPTNSEKLWVADLRKLLDAYPPETIQDLMAYSQSDSQREYNWNCKVFCGNCERNVRFMEATKKTSKWKPVWERYADIVGSGNAASEGHPSPNTLCANCGEPWVSCPCVDDDDLV